jgi:hypothetical protein
MDGIAQTFSIGDHHAIHGNPKTRAKAALLVKDASPGVPMLLEVRIQYLLNRVPERLSGWAGNE